MGRLTQSSSGKSQVSIGGVVTVEQTGFDTLSPGSPAQINVGLTSTMLLDVNPNRKYAHIVNNSGIAIFIQYAVSAVLNQGIKIPANTLYTIETNNLWLGSINAIGVSGGQLIDILEGE